MTDNYDFEVIIIGGSYAGLSAAMSLGRSLRKVLVIDSGIPCNRQTPHSHNFLTLDGERPAVIAARATKQVLNYDTVTLLRGVAVNGKKVDIGFNITTDKDQEFFAKKVVFATGIKDQMPDLPGFSECWGISVIHCPYCHGYEFQGKKTAIMADGDRAFHLASLVRNLTKHITILTNGNASFTGEQSKKLNNHQIPIIETAVSEIDHHNGAVRAVVFQDDTKEEFDAVYAAVPFVQHCNIPAQLGCEFTESGHIKVDGFYKTSVDGVFACGDNSSMMRSVANAVSGGNIAGAMVNKILTDETF